MAPELQPDFAPLVAIGEARPAAAVAAADPRVLGAKAAGLARMAAAGLRVPPLIVVPATECAAVMNNGGRLTDSLRRSLDRGLRWLEDASGLRFGDPRAPLLVSVRSGAPVSMPGMMDTLLNVGLNDATLQGLVRRTGNPKLAWDAYRRLVAAYGEVVEGIAADVFEQPTARACSGADPRWLDFAQLRELARAHLLAWRERAAGEFPQDARVQLVRAVEAVFASWNSPRACEYRASQGIDPGLGTAVAVQAMVFGNAGGLSGSGVGFTRDPTDGTPSPWVDFLFDAQGEDVVSGRRSAHGHESLALAAPAAWEELQSVAGRLESLFGDMQDFEFTIEEGRLFVLQSRRGKRSPRAAVRIALDLVDQGLIGRQEALRRLESIRPEALGVARTTGSDGGAVDAMATAASAAPGVACGEIALDEARARARHREGAQVILVRRDAETADLPGLQLAEGLLTGRGARTSHAAVVARELQKVCLVGCEAMSIDLAQRSVRFDGRPFAEGELITLDGNEGRVYAGRTGTRIEWPQALMQRLAALRAPAL